MKNVKRIISIVLIVAVCVSMIPATMLTASAARPTKAITISTSLPLERYILEHVINYTDRIDITQYVKAKKWTKEKAQEECEKLIKETDWFLRLAEYANVRYENKKYMLEVILVNDYTKHSKFFEIFYEGIAQVNGNMSEVEKALVLHNWLILNMDYDYTYTSFDFIQSLIDGIATCDVYTRLYNFMLNYVGVEAKRVRSKAPTTHAWSYVKIGTKWYNVDVTWDTPKMSNTYPNIRGRVKYDYFLISDAKVEALRPNEYEWELDVKATSTTYEKAFWRNISTDFVYIGDDAYFIREESSGTSKKADGTKTKPMNIIKYNFKKQTTDIIYTFDGIYQKWGKTSAIGQSFATLSEYNGKLYFNDMKTVYSINPDGTELTKITTPNNKNGNIYGFIMDGPKLMVEFRKDYNTKNTFKSYTLKGLTNNTGVKLNKSKLGLSKGKSSTLKAQVSPSTSKDVLYWRSSNPYVAYVTSSGKVVGVNKGQTVISVYTADGNFAECVVQVK